MMATSSTQGGKPTPCELNDAEWIKFKAEFDIAHWDADQVGQRRIGLALVGLGRIGLVHLRSIFRTPRVKLLYCFDVDQMRLDACAKSMFFREFKVQALNSSQFHVALEDSRVHAVIVGSPTSTHEELVRRSLESRKCVMCEKPLTLNSEAIPRLYELARANKMFLTTAFNRHYDADWQRMRQRAKSGSLGSIQLVRITSRNGQRPTMTYLKVSGNIFFDTVIHDLDMMIWIMRQLPFSVQVMARTWKEFLDSDPEFLKMLSEEELQLLPQINDYFLVLISLKFPDGSLGVIDTSRYSSYGNDQRCEVYGSKGMIKCDGQHTSNIYEFNQEAMSNAGIHYTFETRYAKAYEQELVDFITMTDLSRAGIYDNRTEVAAQLSDFPRGTIVTAATRVAEGCTKAARSGQPFEFDWPAEFKRDFYEEAEL